MIAFKGLLITFLSIFITGEVYFDKEALKDCSTFKVTHQTAAKGNSNVLDISIEGGKAPYKVVLSRENGDLVTDDHNLTHFESLRSGKYNCIAGDSQGCKKTLEIIIP